MSPVTERVCRTCKQPKPLTKKFFRVGYVRKKDGKVVFNRECLMCAYTARRNYYDENKVVEIAQVRAWQAANPDNKRASDRRYYASHADKWREGSFAKYGLTVEEVLQILEEQDGRCAICRQLFDESTCANSFLGFTVDHDHSCCPGEKSCGGCVRGLLCQLCNRALGFLRDDPIVVRLALEYLESYERRQQNGNRSSECSS